MKHSTVMMLREAIDFEFVGAARGIRALDWLLAVSVASQLNIHFMPNKTTIVRVHDKGIWNGNTVTDNNRQKNQVRWYCAAHLPEGDLSEAFRRKVVLDWIRSKVATSQLYQPLRPLVLLARKSKALLRQGK